MKSLCILLLGTALGQSAFAGVATPLPADATSLAAQIESGRWPADIVHAADECLNRYPGSACAATAAELRPAAARAAAALAAKDVGLYRSAFMDPQLSPALQADVHLAALGDVHAAVRLAQAYAHGQDASAVEQHRHVGWLQYAAQLGDDAASYDLALHFRSAGEPAIAAVYEARATALGYVPPLALDHIRK